jgi:hypothetical protein
MSNATNMIAQPPPQNTMNPQDMFFMMLMNDRLKSRDKEPALTDRGQSALRSSLDAQNMILNKLLMTASAPDLELDEGVMLRKKIKEYEREDGNIRRTNREELQLPDIYQKSPYPKSRENKFEFAPKPTALSQMLNYQSWLQGGNQQQMMGQYQQPQQMMNNQVQSEYFLTICNKLLDKMTNWRGS